jgi:sugar fermentation stimulation protein A
VTSDFWLPHRLPGPPTPAVLLQRENRFLARCQLSDGAIVHAHVPDRGRLLNLLIPGARVWLFAAPAGTRRTAWSLLVAQEPATGVHVATDPAGANRHVRRLLAASLLPAFGGGSVVHEVTIGASRIDFVLTDAKRRLALEVKNVGVVKDGVALFPDAPTERGVKHLHELAAFAKNRGCAAAVLFVAQRRDARCVAPDEVTDPDFAKALRRVAGRVALHAIRLEVLPTGCRFQGAIPVRLGLLSSNTVNDRP